MQDKKSRVKQTLRRNGFTFKQFFVAHDRCAMKVGTDGVLLGAWANVSGCSRILDIGSGSGLVALMLAQRTSPDVAIYGIELDASAVMQSRENAAESPWHERLHMMQGDVLQLDVSENEKFDLIVSNPPYFEPGSDCRDEARSNARYTNTLTHSALLMRADRLLTPTGRFCVILPYDIGLRFQQLAQQEGWKTSRVLHIRDLPEREPHRMLLELDRCSLFERDNHLSIYRLSREYSCEFHDLMKDFYLFF